GEFSLKGSKYWLLALAVSISGCGASQASQASASAPASAASSAATAGASPAGTRVVMSYSNVDMGHLHEWVAQDLGIYQKNGLTVQDELVSSAAAAMAALLSNQTNFATGSSDAISAAAEGADLIVIDVMI